MTEWDVYVEPPGEWIPVAVRTEAAIDELVSGIDDVGLAHQVEVFARRARDSAAVAAGCLLDGAGADVIAFLEVHSFPIGGEDGMPANLDELAVALRPGTETWSDTERLQLPAGPAIRLRMIDAEPVPDTDRTVVESVSTAVPSPDGKWVAIALLTWTDLALSEQMQELADDTAHSLRFDAIGGNPR